jgi:hypothetical protein
MENGSAIFNCKGTGQPKPKIHWFTSSKLKGHYDTIATDDSRIQILPNKSLLFTNVQKKDQAWYWCFAGNSGIIAQAGAYLKVGFDKVKTTAGTVCAYECIPTLFKSRFL